MRYSRLLEEGDFRGRTGDFVWFLLFCATLMTGAAPFLGMNFLGRPLAFMMVYVWGRWVLAAQTGAISRLSTRSTNGSISRISK